MKNIKCVNCLKDIKTKRKKAVAGVCKDCDSNNLLKSIIKNIDSRKLDNILYVTDIRLNNMNKFGEII